MTITLQAPLLELNTDLDYCTINVDVCEYNPELYLDWGAIDSDLIEEFGPAGGNPNVNITFATKQMAYDFLEFAMDLEPTWDDFESYIV